MPCWELFDEQDQDYQDSVLLSNYNDILRIFVEKCSTKNTGHSKYAHFSVVMPSYGLSGPAAEVEEKLEFTPEYIAAKVWSSWVQRGRNLSSEGDRGDLGLDSWVSKLNRRAGAH
jgi:transketolase